MHRAQVVGIGLAATLTCAGCCASGGGGGGPETYGVAHCAVIMLLYGHFYFRWRMARAADQHLVMTHINWALGGSHKFDSCMTLAR